MNELLYPMIFKRKSFHVFKSYLPLLQEDLEEIKKAFSQFIPLIPDIKVRMRIVPKDETTCKRGEYCILLYSEKKEHFLKNIGYIGAQLNLWLAFNNIGVCWYGAGKVDYYREIDMGIFLCYLELCMEHEGLIFQKELCESNNIHSDERQLCAYYKIF